MYKYFSGAGKVFFNTFQASPAPEKYLNTLLRRRVYILLSGAGEAGEAGEVFIYTVYFLSGFYILSCNQFKKIKTFNEGEKNSLNLFTNITKYCISSAMHYCMG